MSKNPKPFRNIHPSEMVIEEMWSYVVCHLVISESVGGPRLSEHACRLIELVALGKKPIKQRAAKALHKAFDQSAQYWLNLQKNYDEREAEK